MTFRPAFQSGARWSALLLSISFPISVALGNILLATLLLCGLIGYAAAMLDMVRHHPVARAGVVLFLALLVGCAYGATPLVEAAAMLMKYADLAFVPLLLVLFRDGQLRQRAENGFLLAMMVTATLSWLVGLHILSASFCMWSGCSAENPSIFMSHIAHNLMMAYACFLFALRAVSAIKPGHKWWYAACALLTCLDVLLLVQGRTGYVVLGVLLPYFVWTTSKSWLQKTNRHMGWRETAGVLVLVSLALWATYQFSPRLHQRVDEVVSESSAWKTQGRDDTSTGQRLEFYTNSAKVVADHALLGVGTGGFAEAYRQQVAASGMVATRNPHNEYLHLTVQLGIVGIALLLYFLYAQWSTARRLHDVHFRDAATGLVLTLLVTSMFNTPLMDHTEGLFFAYLSALCFATFVPKVRHG